MNTYKLTTILFAIVSAYFIYDKFISTDDLKTLSTEELDELTSIKNDYSELMSTLSVDDESFNQVINRNAGYPIPLSVAREKMSRFKKWNDLLVLKKIKPYAFSFGLDRLDDMREAIEIENDSIPEGENKIVGVRVYLTRTKPDPDKNKHHLDLLFVPVLDGGDDYLDVNQKSFLGDSTNLLLNTSIPCPDYCDQ